LRAAEVQNFTERFEPIREPTSGVILDSKVRSPNMQAKYLELFNAIARNDVEKVTALCEPITQSINADPAAVASASASESTPEPLIVCVKSSLLQMTTLDVALLVDSAEMVRAILRIAKKTVVSRGSRDRRVRG